jgi:hypothetical protein
LLTPLVLSNLDFRNRLKRKRLQGSPETEDSSNADATLLTHREAMKASPIRRLPLLAAVAGAAMAIVDCHARADVVTFDMVDVAMFPGTPPASLVVTTGQQIPGGVNNSAAGNEFNISYVEFDIDGDMNPLPDLRIRTATFAGGQLVYDGFHRTELSTTADGSYVITKGENSYLNRPFFDGEVIGDTLDEFTRDQFGPPGPPNNNLFDVALDEGGSVHFYLEGVDNFVGFRLPSGAVGWIRVQFDGTTKSLTFLDGAYDTSGTPMTAGSTVSGGGVSSDFDGDLDVDGADYLTWQRGVGLQGTASFADGDANADFNVDRGDLAYWKGQFELSSAAAAAVPEPATACLAIGGAMLLGRRRQSLITHEQR